MLTSGRVSMRLCSGSRVGSRAWNFLHLARGKRLAREVPLDAGLATWPGLLRRSVLCTVVRCRRAMAILLMLEIQAAPLGTWSKLVLGRCQRRAIARATAILGWTGLFFDCLDCCRGPAARRYAGLVRLATGGAICKAGIVRRCGIVLLQARVIQVPARARSKITMGTVCSCAPPIRRSRRIADFLPRQVLHRVRRRLLVATVVAGHFRLL